MISKKNNARCVFYCHINLQKLAPKVAKKAQRDLEEAVKIKADDKLEEKTDSSIIEAKIKNIKSQNPNIEVINDEVFTNYVKRVNNIEIS